MTDAADSWEHPETLRTVARDRAAHLKGLKTRYLLELDDARDTYRRAKAAYAEAAEAVDELRALLAPLDDEIAHLEAVIATEAPTMEMLFRLPEKKAPA